MNADELLDNDIVTIGDSSEYTAEEKQLIQQKNSLDLSESRADFSIKGIDVKLGMNNVLGDEKLYKDILMMFYQDHCDDAVKLEIAIKNNDIEGSKHLAHTLKGVACSVGAMTLFDVTKRLDIAINEQQFGSLALLLTDVVSELELVISNIKDELLV